MKTFKVKFFGSKKLRTQIVQVKMEVEAESRDRVEDRLRHFYKYQVINGLKINEVVSQLLEESKSD